MEELFPTDQDKALWFPPRIWLSPKWSPSGKNGREWATRGSKDWARKTTIQPHPSSPKHWQKKDQGLGQTQTLQKTKKPRSKANQEGGKEEHTKSCMKFISISLQEDTRFRLQDDISFPSRLPLPTLLILGLDHSKPSRNWCSCLVMRLELKT